MTKADVMECAELAITPVRPEELRMGTKAAALLIVGLLGGGVHSPGEKLVPIASKKKSVEQQARKTFNKNEPGERKSKKIGFDWTRTEGTNPIHIPRSDCG